METPKLIVHLEITGLENWGLSQDNIKDDQYWNDVKDDIKESLQDQFGRNCISISHELKSN